MTVRRYRVVGRATVDVVVWVEASSEKGAISKAKKLDVGRWKTLHAGHFDEVEISGVTTCEPADGDSRW